MSLEKTSLQDLKVFQVLLHIGLDNKGNLVSDHNLASVEDETIKKQMPSEGESQLAMALLVEAIKREVFLHFSLCLQEKEKKVLSEEDAESVEKNVRLSLEKSIEVLLPDISKEIFSNYQRVLKENL